MADQWHYARQGQQFGPVSGEQLRQLAASGQLQPSDMVWKQGMAAWSPASSVQGLFAAPASGAASDPAGIPPQPGMPTPPQYTAGPGVRLTLPNWSPGAWIILGSLALVVASLFFKWTGIPGRTFLAEMAKEMGMEARGLQVPGDTYATHMGLVNPWVMFVGVFIYPVWMLAVGRPIHLVGGILCGAWGAITALCWILKLTSSANWGLYIYLVSCLALIAGVILYKPTGWRLFR